MEIGKWIIKLRSPVVIERAPKPALPDQLVLFGMPVFAMEGIPEGAIFTVNDKGEARRAIDNLG